MPSSFDKIQELDDQARISLPIIDPSIPPSNYFSHAADCIHRAGEFKLRNDLDMTYLYLMKYFVLITELMPQHPNLESDMDEFHYNCEKCAGRLSQELVSLRNQIEAKSYRASHTILDSPVPSDDIMNHKKNLPPKPALVQNNHDTKPPKSPAVEVDDNKNRPKKKSGFFSRKSKTNTTSPLYSHNNNNNSIMNDNQSTLSQQSHPVSTPTIPEPAQIPDKKVKDTNNDWFSDPIGKGVSSIVNNDSIQSRTGDAISSASQNAAVQRNVGQYLAQHSSNAGVKYLASNQTVQKSIGSAIAHSAQDKQVQQQIGSSIARSVANTDKTKLWGNVTSGVKAGSSLALSTRSNKNQQGGPKSDESPSRSDWWM